MNHSDTLSLSLELLQQPSVTPIDHTCQTIMADRLAKIGFHIEPMRFGEVDNLWRVAELKNLYFVLPVILT